MTLMVGLGGTAASLLVLLVWLKPPRPPLWALGGSAVLAGAATAVMAPQSALWPLIAVALTAGAVAWHDGLTQRIPDTLTAVTAVCVLIAAVSAGGPGDSWLRATLASLVLGAGYLVAGLIGSMGPGDIKYALPLGFAFGWHGWAMVWQATVLGLLIGSLIAAVLLARGRGRDTHMPFGPSMAAGAVLGGVLVAVLA